MNKLAILVAILAIVYASEVSDQNVVLPKNWERAAQSCPANTYADYFWDGQKCEVCMNNCKCNSYLGCKECEAGYGRLYFKHHEENQPEAACYKCGTEGIIEDCCFLSSTTETSDVSPISNHTPIAMRAHKCYEFYGNTKVFQGGAYCHMQHNCAKYNEYGRCIECIPRHYLKSDHTCGSCPSGCQTCRGQNTCDDCLAGYFLPTYWYIQENNQQDKSTTAIANLKLNPSYCEPCDRNCICTKETQPKRCSNCATTVGFWYDQTNQECKSCPKNCTNCPKGVCDSCAERFILTTERACVACPSNCQMCEWNNVDKKAQCKPEACHNGYAYDTTNKDCSIQCPNNIARCEVQRTEGQPDKIIPTQCKQKVKGTVAFSQGWEQVQNKLPITENDFFLIEENGDLFCEANGALKCKKMKSPLPAEQKPFCTECYTTFGYMLSPLSKKCVKCNFAHCTKCEFKAASDELQCTQCVSGRQINSYFLGVIPESTRNYIAVGGQCTPCNDGCLTCGVDKGCSTCQNGYRSNSETTCEKCELNQCMKCDADKANCTQCFAGYRLWTPIGEGNDGIAHCESCEPGCAACQNDRKVCTSCMSGYYLFAGVCRQKRVNCAQWHPDGSCEFCSYGYRNVQGFCYKCADEGYYNCPVGCGVERYIRDGDVLTKSYYDQIMSGKTPYQYGSVLQASVAVCVLLLAALI